MSIQFLDGWTHKLLVLNGQEVRPQFQIIPRSGGGIGSDDPALDVKDDAKDSNVSDRSLVFRSQRNLVP